MDPIWTTKHLLSQYNFISNQSMERLEDENKNKQKNAVQSMDRT